MRFTTTLTLAALTLIAVPARAGQDTGVVDSTADRALERPLNGGLKLEIQAALDDSSATVKTGWTVSRTGSARRYFDALTLAASAPLAKGGAGTSLFASDGFADSFMFTAKYTNFSVPKTARSDEDQKIVDVICEEMRAKAREKAVEEAEADPQVLAVMQALGREDAEALARQVGVTQARQFDPPCDSSGVMEYHETRRQEFDRLMGLRRGWNRFWGVSGSAGYRRFEFLWDDFSEGAVSRVPLGASVFVAALPAATNTLVTLGFEYKRKHKETEEKTRCPEPPGGSVNECRTAVFGEPARSDERAAFVELRRAIGSRAMSLKLAYDFSKDLWNADLPIFIFRNEDSAPSGGVRFGWNERSGGQVGVFVSQAFKLFRS